jgi:hypothetical protein
MASSIYFGYGLKIDVDAEPEDVRNIVARESAERFVTLTLVGESGDKVHVDRTKVLYIETHKDYERERRSLRDPDLPV